MKKKKILIGGMALCLLLGSASLITLNNKVNAEDNTICSLNFNDNNIGDVYGANAKVEIVKGENSAIGGSSGTEGGCVKVSGRTGYWGTSGFAYPIDSEKFEPDKEYLISFDVMHKNGEAKANGKIFDGSDMRAITINYMPDYNRIGVGTAVLNNEWDHVEQSFKLNEYILNSDKEKYIYLAFSYPVREELADYDAGSYENREEYYIDNFTIKEYKGEVHNYEYLKYDYPEGVLYKQRYDITRWYEPATAAQSINGHSHDGYKYNSFAIWMTGAFENEYSTNEDEYNKYWNLPDLTEYCGKELRIKGEISYEGTPVKSIMLHLNYTYPTDYPVMWRWQKGASKEATETAKELKIEGANGSEELAPNTTSKIDFKFTIPKDARNGDKDENGNSYGIYTYFSNKPSYMFMYRNNNIFHFKNFAITEGNVDPDSVELPPLTTSEPEETKAPEGSPKPTTDPTSTETAGPSADPVSSPAVTSTASPTPAVTPAPTATTAANTAVTSTASPAPKGEAEVVVPNVSKVSGVKAVAGRKKLTLKWKKLSNISGYQIQVSLKKNFKGAKTVKVKKSATKYDAKKLKSKKTYYVRIRAYSIYEDADGETNNSYGKWVTAKTKVK